MWSCPHYDAGRYLVFLGRTPPLKTAAKIGGHDSGYFAWEIHHLGRRPEPEHGSSPVGDGAKKCAPRAGEGASRRMS
jgi:hypothetical protein